MTKEIESNRPSPQQEGINAIALAFEASAKLGINTRVLIEEASEKSGLSSKNGPFTQRMVSKEEELRGEAKNNK